MIYPETWEKVTCHDWYEDEKKIWLCLKNKNAICEIDKDTKNVRILGSYPHNGVGESDLSLSIDKFGEYIVFCPFKANDIAILNVSTGKLEFIDLLKNLQKHNYKCDGIEKFYRMVSYKNCVFFLGIKYPAIMKLNLITKKIELFDSWLQEIEEHKCKEAVLFTDGYAQTKNEIYLPIGRCNGVLKINLDTMEWKYIDMKFLTHGILGMTQKNDVIWFTEYDENAESFFQWNLINDEITQIPLPCQDGFYAPLYYDKSLYFFRNFREKSYRYKLELGKWENVTKIIPELKDSSDKKSKGEEINFFSNKSGRLYHCNLKANIISYDKFQINDRSFLENLWIDYCEECKQKGIIEGLIILKDYLEKIVMIHICVEESKNRKKYPIGEHVWKSLRRDFKDEIQK